MTNFEKTLHLGAAPSTGRIFARIHFKDGRLSINGVEGPMRGGDAKGSCGQIVMGYLEHGLPEGFTPAEGWTPESVVDFMRQWDRWHLNDMKAGSPDQEAHLREIKGQFPGYPVSYYDWASSELAKAGLNPAPDGYKYGHAWLTEEVPADVLDYFRNLPDSTFTPAWV